MLTISNINNFNTVKNQPLTLIRAAGCVYDYQNFEQILNLKTNVFLKKCLGSIFCQVILSKKRCFWRFLNHWVGETACHFHIFRAALKAFSTSLTPSTTTPRPGTLPANSRGTKQFLSHPHGPIYIYYIWYTILYYICDIYISELLTTVAAWHRASLSTISRLRSRIQLLAARQRQFI